MAADGHLIASVMAGEGCRLTAYKDTEGVWTAGWGRNLQTMRITQATADEWLREDLATAEAAARVLPCWQHMDTQARRNVLIELVYNMGPEPFDGDGYRDFTNTLAAMARKDWPAAERELLDSKWARQVGARAVRLARLMRTGEYPLTPPIQ